jgi:phosphoribosylformimino-5-aminoimidazole carboxamide ribotide isomerase
VQVVPVLDLLGGQVVRARNGERAAYRPIETPLASGSDPVDVARGLLGLYPFRTLYVADLDAIQGQGDNLAALRRLRAAFPALGLWVDNGAAEEEGLIALTAPELRCEPVLGSESQRDAALIGRHRDSGAVLLSLDFRGAAFQGPPELRANPDIWPKRVIVMTLARVGGGAGPDLGRLEAIRETAPTRALYAAGGVRGIADLAQLRDAGAAGALVASSLHDGGLNPAELQSLEAPS